MGVGKISDVRKRPTITSIMSYISRGLASEFPRVSVGVEQLNKMLSPLRRNGLHHRPVISLAISESIFYSFILQVSPALPQSPPWPRVRFHSCHFHRTHIHILEQRPSFVSKNNNLLTNCFTACLFFLHSPCHHFRV